MIPIPFHKDKFAAEMKPLVSGNNLTLNYENIESSLAKVVVSHRKNLGRIIDDLTELFFGDAKSRIQPTNITDACFQGAAIGQDGKLYFACSNRILRLEDDGSIVTVITGHIFFYIAMGQDNHLYFSGGSNHGVLSRLENNGDIVPVVAPPSVQALYPLAIGQDGKLYFGSQAEGLWRLENDGTIIQTNVTTGYFDYAATGQNGKLYATCSFDAVGICRLENNGDFTVIYTEYDNYRPLGTAQDGKLYFCGNLESILRLENDGTIVHPNITGEPSDLTSLSAAMGQNGIFYFATNHGIFMLQNNDTIVQTNISDGIFSLAKADKNGTLYFFNLDGNIYKLQNNGDIVLFDTIPNKFFYAAFGQDDKLYLSDQPNDKNGIFCLYTSKKPNENQKTAINYLQRAILHFTMYEHTIFLITRVGNDGITVKKNDDETTIFKYQQDQLENQYISLGWFWTNALIQFMNENPADFPSWTDSPQKASIDELPIDLSDFEKWVGVTIGGEYFMFNIAWIIREVWTECILSRIKEPVKDSAMTRAVCYEVMARACERLAYASLPEPIRKDIDNEMGKNHRAEADKVIRSRIAEIFSEKARAYWNDLDLKLKQKDVEEQRATPHSQPVLGQKNIRPDDSFYLC